MTVFHTYSDYEQTLHQLDNKLYTTTTTQDDGLYDHTHHKDTTTPSVYSTVGNKGESNEDRNTLTERAALSDYCVITETQLDSQVTSDCGMMYSAVVHEDGKKTTVTTTAQNGVHDDNQHQPPPDTSNEGLVYSAVVVKDGKKTTVKTMATPQDEDTEQTPDTVQPSEGMVYSAVIRQDGKKTSVMIPVD